MFYLQDEISRKLKYLCYQSKNLLGADFLKKNNTTVSFCFISINMSICNIIKQFQLYINNVIIDTNNVYAYYGFFILFKADTLLTKIYIELVLAIKVMVIINLYFEYYGNNKNNFHFYNFSYSMIVGKKMSKF